VLRRIALLALACALVTFLPGRSGAQTFGQFTGGSIVPMNGKTLGGAAEISGDMFGLMGQLRLSFQPEMDFGFQGGLAFYDAGTSDQTAVRLGADFKARVAKQDAEFAVDITLGAALSVETADDMNVFRIGPSVVVSRHMPSFESTKMQPYLGMQLLFSRENVFDVSESGLMVPVHLGSEFRLGEGLKLLAEVQFRIGNDFGDDVAFTTGITTDF
jgi:hypothetical protein